MNRWLTLLADSVAQGIGWTVGIVATLALFQALGLTLNGLL